MHVERIMEVTIKIDYEHHVENCLVSIILEPNYYGIEDLHVQKDLVIEKLIEMANYRADPPFSSEQIADVYERIMEGDIDKTLREYFIRNLDWYHNASETLYCWVSAIIHEWYLLQYRTNSKRAVQTGKTYSHHRKLLDDLLDCLEGAMLDLEDFAVFFTESKLSKKPL